MKVWRFILLGAALVPAFAFSVLGADKKPQDGMQVVDSGSFGVFVNGRRIATETFNIQQGSAGSTATAEFKTEPGTDGQSSQSSILELSPSGDIRKYEWKELTPGKAQATVEPANEFLTEHIKKTADAKPEEQPFLLPASTSILDDYFFSHRQILIWRYLATTCKQEKGEVKCPVNQKTQFGTMNPQQRSSQPVTLEFKGREKAKVGSSEAEFNKFILKSEGGEWLLFVDNHFKLQRISITSDSTEVVRD